MSVPLLQSKRSWRPGHAQPCQTDDQLHRESATRLADASDLPALIGAVRFNAERPVM